MHNNMLKPDYIFETSWEICNKVGGIYTVISTKVPVISKEYSSNYILIGPDILTENNEHPEFIEDLGLFKVWREKIESDCIKLRIGRWNIAGSPIVFLVDFTPYFPIKDSILSNFWEKFKLDSLHGQWDYIEPALFGYASAVVIEHFYKFYISGQDKVVAHFHEWMTGTGILYLKEKVPQIGTVFTTHATVLGRSIAGNKLSLYSNLENYHPEQTARDFKVESKFSLESLSAKESDSFATVSEITARECEQFLGRTPDIITPNGFEDAFVPSADVFNERRKAARSKTLAVAETLLGYKLPENTLLVSTSGRYEFRNKGIDLFIEALNLLNQNNDLKENILAMVLVPAGHTGPKQELVSGNNNQNSDESISRYLTHYLHDEEHDPVLELFKKNNLLNRKDDKVKVMFVPCYLNGYDGVFNLSYYDLLIGMDITVYPSYYEPWGYTPLESIAFKIPTITTSLAGFGKWVQARYSGMSNGVTVVERNDSNEAYVAEQIAKAIYQYLIKNEAERESARMMAYEISRTALWKNLFDNYRELYSIALNKTIVREELFRNKQPEHLVFKTYTAPKPQWRKVMVASKVPDSLSNLNKLANNLWWSWTPSAHDLFRKIDNDLWKEVEGNPVALLQRLGYNKVKELEQDEVFKKKLNSVYKEFEKYMNEKPKIDKKIAYFCMEFGLNNSLKIFSGGLGMLAGDYLKEASDSNRNMVGIGLLYRHGYFNQKISLLGDQLATPSNLKFSELPITPVYDEKGNWKYITIALPGRKLLARIWRVDVGRVPLYLLDTDMEQNTAADKQITYQLYGGDWENRFKQELLLGVGGIRLLDELKINASLFHSNEGHAAFIGIERLRKLVNDEKLSFAQAIEVVKSTTAFTTHTPVPAGHDTFDENILRTYIPHYAERLNMSWDEFMNLGKVIPNNPNEKFSMSILAMKLSHFANGVSRIHGDVSKQMFNSLFEGYFPEELNKICYVTNGVHMPTWIANRWRKLYESEFPEGFMNSQSDADYWKAIYDVEDRVIWDIKQAQRKDFIEYVRKRINCEMTQRQENPSLISKIMEALNEKALIIGFARRFATYKRAHLLFRNIERLAKIINIIDKPVIFVFAGKAHPADGGGKELIKKIIEISRKPEFLGKIIFLENYDIELAKHLIQSVDVWLNTPQRPMEASGTSGQKAVMNGVINFSVLDGWWAEGYTPGAGWALSENITYEKAELQDDLDAETIYNMLEEEVIPAFYERNDNDIPEKWVKMVKNTIANIAPRFTMKRMIDDYYEKIYEPMFKHSTMICKDNYENARKIATWKRKVLNGWESIEVISVNVPETNSESINLGDTFNANVKIDLNELSDFNIGLEVIFTSNNNGNGNGHKNINFIEEMKVIKKEKNIITFSCNIPIENAGAHDYAFRLFPKHELLPHRQDFPLVKWI